MAEEAFSWRRAACSSRAFIGLLHSLSLSLADVVAVSSSLSRRSFWISLLPFGAGWSGGLGRRSRRTSARRRARCSSGLYSRASKAKAALGDSVFSRPMFVAPRPSPRIRLRAPQLLPTLATGEGLNALYMAYRSRALQLGAARNACLTRAADAWRRGDGAAAKRFSREGHELNARMSAEAAAKLVRERAKGAQDAVRVRDASWSTDPADRTVHGKCCGAGLGVLLGVPSVFYRLKERMEEADATREKFKVPESDHLTLLNVYGQWKSHGYREDWAMRHFLHPKLLRKAREVQQQLEDIRKMQKMEIVSAGTDFDILRKAITAGYFHQAARVKGIDGFINIRTGVPTHLHPTSALYGLGST